MTPWPLNDAVNNLQPMNTTWIKCTERMPSHGDRVLLANWYKNFRGEDVCHVVLGYWVKKFTESGEYEGDDVDYNEEKDEYYWPEGWYERSNEPEIDYRLSGTVTHWMSLPKPPENI